jgi:hypothetical protein
MTLTTIASAIFVVFGLLVAVIFLHRRVFPPQPESVYAKKASSCPLCGYLRGHSPSCSTQRT